MKVEYFQGNNVVSLRPVRRQALFPAIARIEAYWEGLRDGRLMPSRSEIDPRGIADVLDCAFILEKLAPGLARIRLAGMHLNELMAMEVRGMPITAMFLPEARREMQDVLGNVLDLPAIVRLALGSDRGYGHPALDAQMILLPLRDETGRPVRVLGALQARGTIGRGPRRFMIRDIETKALRSDPLTSRRHDPGIIEAEAMPAPGQPVAPRQDEMRRQVDAFARAPARQDMAAGKGTPNPYLRLVCDTDSA